MVVVVVVVVVVVSVCWRLGKAAGLQATVCFVRVLFLSLFLELYF